MAGLEFNKNGVLIHQSSLSTGVTHTGSRGSCVVVIRNGVVKILTATRLADLGHRTNAQRGWWVAGGTPEREKREERERERKREKMPNTAFANPVSQTFPHRSMFLVCPRLVSQAHRFWVRTFSYAPERLEPKGERVSELTLKSRKDTHDYCEFALAVRHLSLALVSRLRLCLFEGVWVFFKFLIFGILYPSRPHHFICKAQSAAKAAGSWERCEVVVPSKAALFQQRKSSERKQIKK